MNIYYGYDDLRISNPVVTLGSFDGVHLGHKRILDRLQQIASEVSGESLAITFSRHPRQVLGENQIAGKLLTTLDEKIGLLGKTGIANLLILEFDMDLSNKDACEFVEDILRGRLGAKILVAGFNHHFGRRREGDFSVIGECVDRYGLRIEKVEPFIDDGHPVSSSRIRDALLAGDLSSSRKMLGYDYSLSGKIVEGKKLGRTIGYPTANIEPGNPDKLIPKNGVYAVGIELDGKMHKGVMSIGNNPTIDRSSTTRSIEVNIFDFEQDIYGKEATVIFRYRLRDEEVFDSLSGLAGQIEEDRKMALKLLG